LRVIDLLLSSRFLLLKMQCLDLIRCKNLKAFDFQSGAGI